MCDHLQHPAEHAAHIRQPLSTEDVYSWCLKGGGAPYRDLLICKSTSSLGTVKIYFTRRSPASGARRPFVPDKSAARRLWRGKPSESTTKTVHPISFTPAFADAAPAAGDGAV